MYLLLSRLLLSTGTFFITFYFRREPDDNPSCLAPMDNGMTDVVRHHLSAAASSVIFSQSLSHRRPCRRKPPQGCRSFLNVCQRFFLSPPGLRFQVGRGSQMRTSRETVPAGRYHERFNSYTILTFWSLWVRVQSLPPASNVATHHIS